MPGIFVASQRTELVNNFIGSGCLQHEQILLVCEDICNKTVYMYVSVQMLFYCFSNFKVSIVILAQDYSEFKFYSGCKNVKPIGRSDVFACGRDTEITGIKRMGASLIKLIFIWKKDQLIAYDVCFGPCGKDTSYYIVDSSEGL